MRKIGILLLMICCLTGCKKEIYDLKEDTSYTIQDELEFQFIKSEVTDIIEPSNKNKSYKYMRPKEEGHVFVDVIMKTMCLSEDKLPQNIYKGKMNIHKKDYNIELILESANYNQLSQTDSLKKNEARYVHLYCEVPKAEAIGNINIELDVLSEQTYKYSFQAEKNKINSDIKTLGDIISLKQSQIALNAVSVSDKIEPSNKGFIYSYIPAENDDEIFIVLQMDFNNISDKAINPREYIYCEYVYGEEKISSQIILESEDHQTLAKSGVIEAKQTRTLYLAMPIKKVNMNREGMIEIFVEGNIYKISTHNE